MSFLSKIKKLIGKILGNKRVGGIDSGRDIFLKIDNKDYRKKQNLLRKLNSYREKRKSSSYKPYQAQKIRIKPLRMLLLLVCLVMTILLFKQNDGPQMIRHALESVAYFKITRIEVTGVRHSTAETIRAASGIQMSDSIFSISDSRIVDSIKAADKWVKDVSLNRIWPDGIEISVKEYEPFALLSIQSETSESKLYYIDRYGYPFIEPAAGMDLDYPVITGIRDISETHDLKAKLEAPLVFLRKATNPHLPFQQVSELHVDHDKGLIIYMVEYPFPVFFGHGEIRNKYNKLWKVLEILYKPRKQGMKIARVAYIRLDYLEGRVIVGYSESG